jgi:hypothetical protein
LSSLHFQSTPGRVQVFFPGIFFMQSKWWWFMGRCRKSGHQEGMKFTSDMKLTNLWSSFYISDYLLKPKSRNLEIFTFFCFFSTFGNWNPKKTPHFRVSDFVMWLKWQCSWLPTGTYCKNLVIWILFSSKSGEIGSFLPCKILYIGENHIFQVKLISTKKKTTANSVLSWHLLNVIISH